MAIELVDFPTPPFEFTRPMVNAMLLDGSCWFTDDRGPRTEYRIRHTVNGFTIYGLRFTVYVLIRSNPFSVGAQKVRSAMGLGGVNWGAIHSGPCSDQGKRTPISHVST